MTIILPDEIWKPMHFTSSVKNSNYMVSSIGNVKHIESDTILKPYVSTNGHSYMLLEQTSGLYKLYLQENIVASTFVEIPESLINKRVIVNHLDGDSYHNSSTNLIWNEAIEQWKPICINGVMLKYDISNFGNVMSHRYTVPRLMKPQHTVRSYLQIRLVVDDKSYNFAIHRLVATAFIDNPNNNDAVNHIDGNPENCSWLNLEWVTLSENTRHAVMTGLHSNFKTGMDNPSNKYNDEQIHFVCKLLMDGKTIEETAQIANVSTRLIKAILYENRWSSISSLYDLQNRCKKSNVTKV